MDHEKKKNCDPFLLYKMDPKKTMTKMSENASKGVYADLGYREFFRSNKIGFRTNYQGSRTARMLPKPQCFSLC